MRLSSIGNRRGGALLAVLWLTAALAAIAFSVASTVRGELERATTLSEGVRARYLAVGAVERSILWCRYGSRSGPPPGQGGDTPRFSIETPRMRFAFPTGEAVVEVIPETSKLNVNKAPPEAFLALLTALGADPARAQAITAAILHWRGGGLGPLDQYYLSLGPTFRPRHASVQDVEELANAQGMTPELFHGNYVRDHQGRMVRLGAFKDCVSVWGSTGPFDVNTVEPAVMAAVGIHPEIAQRIVEYRRLQPVMNDRQMAEIAMIAGPGAGRLRRAGGNSIYTLRATARLRLPNGRLGDLSRTVAATVKFVPPTNNPPHYVLRWDETGTSEVSQW